MTDPVRVWYSPLVPKPDLTIDNATEPACQPPRIHPTAIVHPKARLDSSVQVGPYAVIDEDVELGEGCVVGPHVHLTGRTTIGARNKFYASGVIGEASQDLKYAGEPTRLRIGDRNTFREHVTVNRSSVMEEDTVIGSNNLLMAHCHVAHNVLIGNNVILSCGALLAGHVVVSDRAIISGNCVVHQFVRIGTLAMMQGSAAISKDLPPFTIVRWTNSLSGLNVIGLRRAGFTPAERLELKQVYKALFRSGLNLSAALEEAQKTFTGGPAKVFLDFVLASKRGVCFPTRGRGTGEPEEEE